MTSLRALLRDLSDIQQGIGEVRKEIQAIEMEGPVQTDLEGPLGDVDRLVGTGEVAISRVAPGLSRIVGASERLSGRLRRPR